MMRRTLIASSFLLATLATARADAPPTPAPVSTVDADEALALLKEGNARFVSGESTFPNLDQDRRCFTTEGGQHPYVSVLSCADSRVPPELVFDAGIGDLFVIRVAGNVADTDEIGTLEYGAGHLKTPLIVVMGHTKCGAVTAVVNNATVHGSIPKLVDNIAPAVAETRAKYGGVTEGKLVQYAIRANVFQSVKDVLTRSEEIRELVSEGKVRIVGAVYDIHNGTIDWLGEHPQQTALLGEPAHEPAEALADSHETKPDAHGETEASAHDDGHAAPKAESHGNEPHAVPAAKKADPHAEPAPSHSAPAAKSKSSAAHSASDHPSSGHGEASKDAHGSDTHDAGAAHGEKDSHGATTGHGEKGTDPHADPHAAATEHQTLVQKHGLLVPGVFLAAGSVLSGTIVFVLKHKPAAVTPPSPASAHAEPAPAAKPAAH